MTEEPIVGRDSGPTAAATSSVSRPGPALPSGTVTFLLTDIEGSTRMWESVPDAMGAALDRHNQLLTEVINANGGVVVTARGEGDSMFAVFSSAAAAVQAAGDCQVALAREPWPPGATIRVRMGLHTGEAHTLDGDYVEHAPINRCARVKAAAHGGQVLVTRATADLVAKRLTGGFGLRRLGTFRLRDLADPELLYQLTHPELPEDFPPLRTLGERASNLPLQVSSFVGRDEEVERVGELLQQARLVTLTGPGGVGKTRLAEQVAEGLADSFPDGVWLCELAPVRDPALVADAVASVFDVAARNGESTLDALLDFLRAKDTLLVLDNCEHVLLEAGRVAGELVRSCPRLVVLATSREALGIEGERLVPVAPLRLPDPDQDLAAIAAAEAVQLFAQRAAAVKPGFALTVDNAGPVAGVVRRLDGLALAIELAAARIQAMTPAELLRRLQRSFAVLAAGHRAIGRHQTLRATIDWSFQLLTQPEQQLLSRLAVFAGDATLEAVETVCSGDGIDPDDVLDMLASLVTKSLVVAEDHGSETRYQVLETIRQYGEERLREAGELEHWREQHARYYAELLQGIRQDVPGDDRFWALRLSAEQDNLLAAWSWAIAADSAAVAFQILAGFAPSEVSSTYPMPLPGEAALNLPGAEQDPRYPLALAVSANFAATRADTKLAEELCRRALQANTASATPQWRVEQVVCTARANAATINGAFPEAGRYHEQSAAIARAGGDLADTSVELAHAVASYTIADDAASGAPLAGEALALARRINARALIATALLEVASVLVTSDPQRARALLQESLELSDGLGYRKARDLVWAAGTAFLLNDRALTLDLASSAVLALQRSGNRLLMGITMQLIAGMLASDRPESAAVIMGAAEAHVIESTRIARLVEPAVAAALGEGHIEELRQRGADMPWDTAVEFARREALQALAGSGGA